MKKPMVLRRHKLAHIPELKIAENVLGIRYRQGCAMSRCSGACCREGVVVEILERDRILAKEAMVRSFMDESQEQDPQLWFEEEFDDPDSPIGQASGTRVHNDKCVFLNAAGRCVLQLASQASHEPLKPFYCYAYPVCVTEGELVIDDIHCPKENQCCGAVAGGELSILDVCAWELEYVLGAQGLQELREIFGEAAGQEAREEMVSKARAAQ